MREIKNLGPDFGGLPEYLTFISLPHQILGLENLFVFINSYILRTEMSSYSDLKPKLF